MLMLLLDDADYEPKPPHAARSSKLLEAQDLGARPLLPVLQGLPNGRLDTPVLAIDLSERGTVFGHKEPRRGFVHRLDAPSHQGEGLYPALCHVEGRDCTDGGRGHTPIREGCPIGDAKPFMVRQAQGERISNWALPRLYERRNTLYH